MLPKALTCFCLITPLCKRPGTTQKVHCRPKWGVRPFQGAGFTSELHSVRLIRAGGGGDEGRRKASNFSCTFFLGCLVFDWLVLEGAGVGLGGVGTRRTDILAMGAQPCVTPVPKHSSVMQR